MLLIRYKDNWADEMDVAGFAVMTEAQWEWFKEGAAEVFREQGVWTFSVGTNEEIDYQSFDDWLKKFKVVTISDTVAAEITDAFKQGGAMVRKSFRDGADSKEVWLEDGFFALPEP